MDLSLVVAAAVALAGAVLALVFLPSRPPRPETRGDIEPEPPVSPLAAAESMA
jgi:hypothetical protein